MEEKDSDPKAQFLLALERSQNRHIEKIKKSN